MANLYGLKVAEGKARSKLYDAADVSTVREAVEKLGASHPAVQAFRRITKAIDNHVAANPPIGAMSRGTRGMYCQAHKAF